MTEVGWPDYFGYTLFCDDIRREVGGKTTIVGKYEAYLFLEEEFPVILPRFCLYVTYIEKQSAEIPDLELMIFMPGDGEEPSIRHAIPELKKGDANPELGDDIRQVLQIPVNLAPFPIKEEGPIKVRMRRGKDIVRLGLIYAKKGSKEMFEKLAS